MIAITQRMSRGALVLICFGFAATGAAQELDGRLTSAQQRIRTDDLDGALRELEPLLQSPDVDAGAGQHARELAARALHLRGEEHFRRARIVESLADFDRELRLQPNAAAGHWQRGITLYYAGEFEKGARQFEMHKTVNPEDVENAAWHFSCVVRAPKGSVEKARANLIRVTRDPRVPMAQLQQMFAGQLPPEDVLRAAGDDSARFYADLYVGLYYEVLGRDDESLRHVVRAAENPAAKDNYMGDVARVHVTLRK
jgi:lipoprotein NlpI